jgi:hypothetical protein
MAGATELGRHKARCVAVRLLMPPVENRTYPLRAIRLHTCGPSPCSHDAFLPISPAPRCVPRGQLARSRGTFGPVLPQARGLRHQSSSCCPWLSHAPTTMPHPTLLAGLGVALGAPLPTAHAPSHPASSLPCSPCRPQPRWLRGHVPRGPVHSLWLPSPGIGSTGASMPPSAEPLLYAASASSPARGGVERDWLTQKVRCVRGSVSRRAMRASGDLPSHLLAQHHLLATSLRLMVSFRSMRLTLQSGLERLTPQAHRVPVYPTVFPHSDMALHGARSGRWRQSAGRFG